MEIKITFENMEHSPVIEQQAKEKILKIRELIQDSEWRTPRFAELWLKANKQHNHHLAKLHLKTPDFDLNAHEECPDMYLAIDKVIDKMINLVRKEKSIIKDKRNKQDSERKNFTDDKYNL